MTEDSSPGWLDNAFLERALRSGDDPTITVTSSEVKRATAIGDNYLSEMYRANVKFTRNGVPEQRSLIIKSTFNTEGKMTEILSNSNVFEHEINTFSIFPEIIRLQKKAFKQNYQPFSAQFMCSTTDESRSTIVLEDLKEQGFKIAELPIGLDLKHCLLVMRKIAKYHAASVVLHHRKPEVFDQFMDNYFTTDSIYDFQPFFQAVTGACAKEVNNWPDYKDRFGNKLNNVVENGLKNWGRAFIRQDTDFNVLLHGDLWKNNMMFKYSEETGEVEDVRFVDFQLSLWCSPANDLQYFMNSSASLEVLDNTQILLDEYFRTLTESLQLLGCEQLQPTASHINEQFEKKGYFGAIIIHAPRILALGNRDKGPDMNKVMAKEEEFLLTEANKESLRKLLPLYESKGWI